MPDPASPDADVTVPTLLERRYRGWLRLLPADYRARWAEEMVDTFLATALRGDPADEDALEIAGYGKPPLAEVASVVGLAVRLRLGAAERAPRPLLWRAAWRRVAMLGLLVHATWAVIALPGTLWLELRFRDETAPISPPEESLLTVLGTAWQALSSLAALGWVGAFVALLLARRRTAAVLALLALGPYLWNTGRFLMTGPFPVATLVTVAVDVLPVVALVAFVGSGEPVRRRRWLQGWALALGLLLLAAGIAWLARPSVLVDPNALGCLAVFVAAAVWIAGRPRRPERDAPDPAWSLALAIVASVLLVERVATIAPFWQSDGPHDAVTTRLMYSGLVEAALVAAAAAAFGAGAARALHRLPVTVSD